MTERSNICPAYSYVIVLFISLITCGCALGNVGTIAAKVSNSDTATIIDVYPVGINLRTQKDDKGLGIGWSKRTFIIQKNNANNIEPGWHYLKIPGLPEEITASNIQTYGFDLSLSQLNISLNLGYQAVTVMALMPMKQSILYSLNYDSDQPELTQLTICKEEERCALNY